MHGIIYPENLKSCTVFVSFRYALISYRVVAVYYACCSVQDDKYFKQDTKNYFSITPDINLNLKQ
jgi:hypothetical protein